MAIFRNSDNITLSLLDFLRIVQPDLDTKPGTVARDLFVDAPATELSKLYIELRNISNLQSFSGARSTDLDKLASNFGLRRGTGAAATGVATITMVSLQSDIPVPANSLFTARNGFTFRALAQTTVLASAANVYKANAIRLRTDLDLAGISDQYAVEVAVEATTVGLGGNIGKFGLTTQNIPGISNITNVQSFTGGTASEADDVFRSRIFGIFAGSNTGTALGYINALLNDSRIVDVLTVEPGDPLMTRDGSDVITNSSGERIIISAGTGGKVDIYIQGSAQEQIAESYIYKDKSGKNDPSDVRNDFILGQRGISTALDFQQRRRLSLQNGQLPYQPVEEIVSITGSLSGPNFIQATTDAAGNTIGTFELQKDEAAFGGSPFGFDKIHFISGEISLSDESVSKGIFNGQDALDFTDINSIDSITQNIVINNEAPALSATDRSVITVSHSPVSTVERVVNTTTGERYIIKEQSETGVIQISGSTLPASTDILQASYIWAQEYDDIIDYDNLSAVSDFRTVQDSVDWGFSNRVLLEEQTVVYSAEDGYHVIIEHPASKVVNVNTYTVETQTNVAGKIVVSDQILNILNIKNSDGLEVFNTKRSDGSFSGREITLPTDTLLQNSQSAVVRYNKVDIFSPDGYEVGTFTDNVVRLPDGTVPIGSTVFVDYVANVETLLPTTSLASLPIIGSGNDLIVNSTVVGQQPVSNIFSGSNIVRNLRFAPSYLRLNLQGLTGRGRLSIKGTSFIKIEDTITIRQDSLTIDLAESIKSKLGLSSIPSTGYVSYLDSVERITLENGQVASVDHQFDTTNYSIKINTYSNGLADTDATLAATQIKLRSVSDNTDNNPTTGQKFRVVYYYTDSAQVENITITSADPVYTKYKYLFVSNISIASGFTGLSNTVSGTISITNTNQPISGSTYSAAYSYVAPKDGERITINYTYNRVISDATFAIEAVRPITADVLVRAAKELSVDITLAIVPTPDFINNTTNLQQAIVEQLTIFLTSGGLNRILDASDIINAVYNVSGTDRAILRLFNRTGSTGIVKTIEADRDEFFVAGLISVIIETR